MLKKLLKHDFRALSRTLFPLQIGVLSGGLLATLLTLLTIRLGGGIFETGEPTSMLQGIVMGISVLTSVLIAFAIAASAFVTLLIVCIHFYRSFLCDEGYLTFTLPVSTSKLLWSKLLTGMLWMLINAVVIVVTILIFAVFGTSTAGVVNYEVLNAIKEFFSRILPEASQYMNVTLVAIETAVVGVLAFAAQVLEIYFAILVGGQIAKKHRILAAIGMYLLINMGVGIVSSVYMSVMSLGEGLWAAAVDTIQEGSMLFTSIFGWYGVLSAGLCVLFFFLSRGILKKNLNLQ